MLVWLGRLAFTRLFQWLPRSHRPRQDRHGATLQSLPYLILILESVAYGHGAHDSLADMLETPEASVRCVIFRENAMGWGVGPGNGAVRNAANSRTFLFGKQTMHNLTTGQLSDEDKQEIQRRSAGRLRDAALTA